ncbi:MAG TPA: 3-dehydroquinate synthase [bacterium]|nr:3-dehydroquinate synthase [bacterium]
MPVSASLTVTLDNIANRSYDISIGTALMGTVASDLRQGLIPGAYRYVIVTDTTVKKLYGTALLALLRKNKLKADLLSFPAGERSKTRETKARLEDRLLKLGCGRDSCIIALGGGVVTDLAGFVAATYMRGIPYISLPTTLLAAADASIGGKTGVDTPLGKNLIGAFYQPKRVYIDVATWQTLPLEHIQNGLAETIKHAAIADKNFFRYLEQHLDKIIKPKKFVQDHSVIPARIYKQLPVELQKAIGYFTYKIILDQKTCLHIARKNCEIKAAIVEQDEKEQGLRQLLNFGHTIGHALEAQSKYHLSHGRAVSIGMALEAELGVILNHTTPRDMNRLIRLLDRAGLPIRSYDINAQKVSKLLSHDKKSKQGKAQFVFLERIGKAKQFAAGWSTAVDAKDIQTLLQG